MQNHFKLSDSDFKNQFVRCELNPSDFTHEAHLRLAWININELGINKALDVIQIRLLNYVEYVGAKDKYNETVTIAAMKAVYHFMQKSSTNTFKEFIQECPQLNHDFKRLIATHYSFDIFNSDKAKLEFLEPDLAAFD